LDETRAGIARKLHTSASVMSGFIRNSFPVMFIQMIETKMSKD